MRIMRRLCVLTVVVGAFFTLASNALAGNPSLNRMGPPINNVGDVCAAAARYPQFAQMMQVEIGLVNCAGAAQQGLVTMTNANVGSVETVHVGVIPGTNRLQAFRGVGCRPSRCLNLTYNGRSMLVQVGCGGQPIRLVRNAPERARIVREYVTRYRIRYVPYPVAVITAQSQSQTATGGSATATSGNASSGGVCVGANACSSTAPLPKPAPKPAAPAVPKPYAAVRVLKKAPRVGCWRFSIINAQTGGVSRYRLCVGNKTFPNQRVFQLRVGWKYLFSENGAKGWIRQPDQLVLVRLTANPMVTFANVPTPLAPVCPSGTTGTPPNCVTPPPPPSFTSPDSVTDRVVRTAVRSCPPGSTGAPVTAIGFSDYKTVGVEGHGSTQALANTDRDNKKDAARSGILNDQTLINQAQGRADADAASKPLTCLTPAPAAGGGGGGGAAAAAGSSSSGSGSSSSGAAAATAAGGGGGGGSGGGGGGGGGAAAAAASSSSSSSSTVVVTPVPAAASVTFSPSCSAKQTANKNNREFLFQAGGSASNGSSPTGASWSFSKNGAVVGNASGLSATFTFADYQTQYDWSATVTWSAGSATCSGTVTTGAPQPVLPGG